MLVVLFAALVLRSAVLPSTAAPTPVVTPRDGVDTTAIYAAVIEIVRTEYPGRDVLLSETLCDDFMCDPHFEGVKGRPVHPAARVDSLRSSGPVRGTCRLPERTVGCLEMRTSDVLIGFGRVMTDEFEMPPHRHSFAKTWPQRRGDVWVTAFTVASCTRCRHSDASAYRYLLRRSGAGRWEVLGVTPVWII